MFVASAGVLSVSHRTDPAILPRNLRGANGAVALKAVKHGNTTTPTSINSSAEGTRIDEDGEGHVRGADGGTKERTPPRPRSEVRGADIACSSNKHLGRKHSCTVFSAAYPCYVQRMADFRTRFTSTWAGWRTNESLFLAVVRNVW